MSRRSPIQVQEDIAKSLVENYNSKLDMNFDILAPSNLKKEVLTDDTLGWVFFYGPIVGICIGVTGMIGFIYYFLGY